jgi:DNA-binding MarR family transcriptional regulator
MREKTARNQEMAALFQAGVTTAALAKRYKISRACVDKILLRLKAKQAKEYSFLTQDEKKEIIRLWDKGVRKAAQIARKVGRCDNTVAKVLIEAGRREKRDPLERRDPWEKDAEEKLKQLYDDHSARQIASIIGCTRNAVIGKAHRMGLSKSL